MNNIDNDQPNEYFKNIFFFWKHFNAFTSSEFSRESMSLEDRKKYSIFLLFGGNKDYFELGSILQDTQLKLKNSGNSQVTVSELIQPYLDYGKPISFDVKAIARSVIQPIIKSIALVLLTVFIVSIFTKGFEGFSLSLPFFIPAAFFILICMKYLKLVNIVSKQIIKYDSLKDSGLTSKSQLKQPLFQWLSSNMEGFNRGKIENYLTEVYLAEKNIEDEKLEYIAFKYTSVVSSSKDRNGKTTYETDTYRGILLPCSGLGKLAISPDKKVKSKLTEWTTVSQDFNKRFNIWCDQEMDASKLLSPATIADIEKFDNVLGSLNIFTSPSGDICLLFKADFEEKKSQGKLSLSEPLAFLTSLNEDNSSPTLTHVLNLIMKLMAQINVDKPNPIRDFINDLPEESQPNFKPGRIQAEGENAVERFFSVMPQLMEDMKKAKESKK